MKLKSNFVVKLTKTARHIEGSCKVYSLTLYNFETFFDIKLGEKCVHAWYIITALFAAIFINCVFLIVVSTVSRKFVSRPVRDAK